MTNKSLVLLLGLTVFLGGCVVNNNMYGWENYSSTLYGWKKNATDESAIEHRAELSKIIEKSHKKGVRVPPGIYCEYGYMLLLEGDEEQAFIFFEKEAEEYPESKIFVDFLLERSKSPDNEEVSNEVQVD